MERRGFILEFCTNRGFKVQCTGTISSITKIILVNTEKLRNTSGSQALHNYEFVSSMNELSSCEVQVLNQFKMAN